MSTTMTDEDREIVALADQALADGIEISERDFRRRRESLPHATILRVPNAGRYVHLDEPEGVIDEIRKFFLAHT